TCHCAKVLALHPKPPDRLVLILVKRSDRVEHSKFLLFINKFKDLTYVSCLKTSWAGSVNFSVSHQSLPCVGGTSLMVSYPRICTALRKRSRSQKAASEPMVQAGNNCVSCHSVNGNLRESLHTESMML
ncbi:MAG: hypothetical protein ACHBNF_09890, partial [Chromatiales bacterium]